MIDVWLCVWLCHQVNRVTPDAVDSDGDGLMGNVTAGGDDDDDDGSIEYVVIEDDFYYLEPVMRFLAILHMMTAFCMVVAYYCLKVIAFHQYVTLFFNSVVAYSCQK